MHGTPVYRQARQLAAHRVPESSAGAEVGRRAEAVVSIVVLQAEDRQFGLVVDGINDTQEIVVKPLGKQLKGLSVYAGATIMGDGAVALILDVLGIGQRSGVLAESREQARAAAEQKTQSGTEQQRLLLFRAGSFERLAVPLSLVARLEEFPQSAIEHAGGGQVVQYRNRILPLVPLRSVLEPGASGPDQTTDPVQVVVFNDGERSLGMVVDQILDVAEEAVTVRQKSSRKGLLGSAVVGKRGHRFPGSQRCHSGTPRRIGFRAQDGVDERQANPGRRGFGVLARADPERPGHGGLSGPGGRECGRGDSRAGAAAGGRRRGGAGSSAWRQFRFARRHAPAAGMGRYSGAGAQRGCNRTGPGIRRSDGRVQDCQPKFDRSAMLESVARLASALAFSEAAPAAMEASAATKEER